MEEPDRHARTRVASLAGPFPGRRGDEGVRGPGLRATGRETVTEFETSSGGTWRLAGCRDHWSKYELGWRVAPTANQHDAIAAVELAPTEAERLAGGAVGRSHPSRHRRECRGAGDDRDRRRRPVPGVPFEAFIATHPELRHVRTRVRSPGQNGSRERGFGTVKYERLFLEEIPDVLDLIAHAEDYRTGYNTIRPHEALSWKSPVEVHTGLADPRVPNFPEPRFLPTA